MFRQTSFGTFVYQAREIYDRTANPDVKRLAEIVGRMAQECETEHENVKEAYEEARRAKRG